MTNKLSSITTVLATIMNLALRLIITGVLLSPLCALAQEKNPLLREALDAFNKGDYNKAIAACDKAIARNPRDTRAYFYRSNAYSYRAESNNSVADYGRAIVDSDQIIRLDPKSPDGYNHRGIIYGRKGDYNKSVADFTKAIQLDPQYYPAYNNRGNTYDDNGEYDKALTDYDKAILLNPKDSAVRNDRGTLYMSKGNYDKALQDFNEALRLDPENPTIYYNRAIVYGHKGDYDKDIADNNRAIGLNARSPAEQRSRITAFANRGFAYSHKGDYEKAIANFNEAIRRDPKSPDCYNELAWFLATCPESSYRDGKKAVEYATKACELSRWKNPKPIDTLAAAEAEIGNFEQAIKFEQRYLQSAGLTKEDVLKGQRRLALYRQNKPYHEEKSDLTFRQEKP